MTHITANLLETNLADLDCAVNELTENNFHDIVETIETAMLLLRSLQRAEILPWEAIEEEGPVTGDLGTLRELCAEMKALQLKDIELKAQRTENKIPLDGLRLRKIPELMATLEVKTATFPGIGRVQVAPDLYCSTVKGRKGDAMVWLRDMGLDEMISETYNSGTMKALVRRLIIDGTEVPDFLSVTPFLRASVVKV